MGNQASKDGGGSSAKGSASAGEGHFQSYPSFSRSDTRESSRSFRSLRSKIPGGAKTDSPRNSTVLSSSDLPVDKTADAASVRSGRSGRSSMSRTSRGDLPPLNRGDLPPLRHNSADLTHENFAIFEDQPPPSPVSASALRGGNHDVSAAQASGEVDHVSDQPPSANAGINTHMQAPGQPILMKRDSTVSQVHRGLSADSPPKADANGTTTTTVAMADIKDIDLDDFIKRLLDAGYAGKVTKGVCLKNAEIVAICQRAREVLLSQPALLELDAPVKIVGDVHGQYTDLIRMFEMCGFPPMANYLFLGDYVDRGKQSLETILLLLCYKLKFPENFFLLRGNHECANVTRVYGFYDECKRRCNVKIWKTFVDCFNTLPIAAIVAGKIFCVHGGLSPALSHMDDIRNIARPTDVPDYGLLNDLLWSDPADMEQDWEANERGVSYCFGKRVINDFLAIHDFDLICRAHMVVEDGYEFFHDRVLVTVFSAPNYCGEFDNWGAVMSVSSELLCSFELLKPLDSSALKSHIKKGRNKRQQMLNSPPANEVNDTRLTGGNELIVGCRWTCSDRSTRDLEAQCDPGNRLEKRGKPQRATILLERKPIRTADKRRYSRTSDKPFRLCMGTNEDGGSRRRRCQRH
ncbi:hypothetical protein XA68_12773 [Ophiocordyceps unilateralis]|uniref:Serine/threonine-protein phosphatase n=1 Tax=Ophiocordyceps unilateralis TaxID=268505 RepID=A0A2A9PE07_OPHUN|nr:hypothetical protein XA68_12773 [Ophiocordyceps unilateralis]